MDFAESPERASLRSAVRQLGERFGLEYGGSGGSLYYLMIVGEELATAGVPLMTLLEAFATQERKQAWLSGIGSGDSRMAFAITEPDAGAIRTTSAQRQRSRRMAGIFTGRSAASRASTMPRPA
jgi:alkylation response protein AidB-like acyl-CoA dehydrogenase